VPIVEWIEFLAMLRYFPESAILSSIIPAVIAALLPGDDSHCSFFLYVYLQCRRFYQRVESKRRISAELHLRHSQQGAVLSELGLGIRKDTGAAFGGKSIFLCFCRLALKYGRYERISAISAILAPPAVDLCKE